MGRAKRNAAAPESEKTNSSGTKRVAARKRSADTAKAMLWLAPALVFVAIAIAYFSDSGHTRQPVVAETGHAAKVHRRDAAPTENSTPGSEGLKVKRQQTREKAAEPAPEEPGQLPRGWASAVDPSSGKSYYYKIGTRESQWEFPTQAYDEDAATEEDANCASWAAAGECSSNPDFMRTQCKVTCERADAQQTSPVKLSGTSGLRDTWKTPSDCIAWAGSGECENNPSFMSSNCALSCSPEERAASEGRLAAARAEYATRCPRAEGVQPALAPGAMNATFERILAEFGALSPELVSSDPPVVLFHNFLSDEEAAAFVAHGKGKYSESRGVGFDKDGKMTDVKTEIRTSRHTWCQDAGCLADPLVQGVQSRVSDVTQTPVANGEFAQLVYYHACPSDTDASCAFYKRHSDYIDGDRHRIQGVRIYTLFMYLNDVPEGGGGGTRFTDLSPPVTFMPKKGKAVLWPSVKADDPDSIDPRTHHEALPVLAGEKFGANFWIHQYDFRGPHSSGCTMG